MFILVGPQVTQLVMSLDVFETQSELQSEIRYSQFKHSQFSMMCCDVSLDICSSLVLRSDTTTSIQTPMLYLYISPDIFHK